MTRCGALSLAVLLGLAGSARAGTYLFLQGDPGASVGGGMRRLVDSTAGAFVVNGSAPGGVVVEVFERDPPAFDSFRFAPPTGTELGPGNYQVPAVGSPGTATLEVTVSNFTCTVSSGRFTVREVVYGPDASVLAFAADFESHCQGEGPALFGAVRYHAGAAACQGAPDGTPCNDHDICTRDDVCRAGECIGTAGACSPLGCSDGDACTTDGLDASDTCASTPIPGVCWDLAGSVRLTDFATASRSGRTVECRARCEDPLTGAIILRDDGTYLGPNGALRCASGQVARIPDEVGTWRARRDGRLRVRPQNWRAIVRALGACRGVPLRPKLYRLVLRLLPDGAHLSGSTRQQVGVGGHPSFVEVVSTVGHFTGTRRGATPAAGPLPTGELPSCAERPDPVCVVH